MAMDRTSESDNEDVLSVLNSLINICASTIQNLAGAHSRVRTGCWMLEMRLKLAERHTHMGW